MSSGYRLLKQCLRHALDPRAFPMENRMAHIFKNSSYGEIGLVLSNKVPASMKDADYNVTTAFTSNQIIATKCDCPAVCQNSKRVLCVHNLPLIYQMVVLLDDGLAKHLLIELCSQWHPGLENLVQEQGQYKEVRNSLY